MSCESYGLLLAEKAIGVRQKWGCEYPAMAAPIAAFKARNSSDQDQLIDELTKALVRLEIRRAPQ